MSQLFETIRRDRNKGVSVIEIIVVVMIIGIVATTAIMSLSAMQRASSTRASKELSAALDKARLVTMTHTKSANHHLKIYLENGMYFADIRTDDTTANDPVEICNSSVSITAQDSSGSWQAIDANGISIYFEKSSGAFKDPAYQCIKVSGAKTVDVVLVKNTGRNYLE